MPPRQVRLLPEFELDTRTTFPFSTGKFCHGRQDLPRKLPHCQVPASSVDPLKVGMREIEGRGLRL